MKSLESLDLFNPGVTSVCVRKGVRCVVEERGERKTDCGWAKGLTIFLGAVGIMEQENQYVLQSDRFCSLLLMHMRSLLSMAPLFEFCRKNEKQSVIFMTWAVLQMFVPIADSRTCVQ